MTAECYMPGRTSLKPRGRLGFWKKEWLELGGYDESLTGYGHDDADLMHRAWEMGFILVPFSRGGDFTGIVKEHNKHADENMVKSWWITEGENRCISWVNLLCGRFVANKGREWGKGHLIVNFEREIDI